MLLAAGSELFAERGFRETTFADLAERAGISRGCIAWHFGNKEGLLVAVVQEQSEAFIATLEQIASMTSTEIEEFLQREDAAGTLLRSAQLFLALYNHALKPDSPIHEAFVDLHTRVRSTLERWAAQNLATPGGTTSSDAAVAILGAVIGICLQWMIAPDLVTTETSYRAMRTILEPMLK